MTLLERGHQVATLAPTLPLYKRQISGTRHAMRSAVARELKRCIYLQDNSRKSHAFASFQSRITL